MVIRGRTLATKNEGPKNVSPYTINYKIKSLLLTWKAVCRESGTHGLEKERQSDLALLLYNEAICF